MIEQVIQTPGGFKNFAPLIRRVAPLGPPAAKPKRVTPIAHIMVLPERDLAPALKPVRLYYDPASPHDPEWRLRAVCRGKGDSPQGIAPWYPGPGGSQRGKIYCAVCPVRRECDKFADDNNIEWGIWGGRIRHRVKKSEQKQQQQVQPRQPERILTAA